MADEEREYLIDECCYLASRIAEIATFFRKGSRILICVEIQHFVFHHETKLDRLNLFHGDGLALKTYMNLKHNRQETRIVVDLDTLERWALQGTVEEFAPHQHPAAYDRICQGFAAGNWGRPSRVFRFVADRFEPIAPFRG